ncbi:MAG: S-adenosylmethionine decarboxylase [Parcubacteria group bacterium]
MAFGYHLMLDIYGCDTKAMQDFDVCYAYLNKLPDIIHTNKQSEPFLVKTDGVKFPDKAGFSGWIPLVESGISIHTLDPMRFISIDVYTCKQLDQQKIDDVKKYTDEIFHPQEWEEKFVLRGEKYELTHEVEKQRKEAEAMRHTEN